MLQVIYILLTITFPVFIHANIPMYWWKPEKENNFGDILSPTIVGRIIDEQPVRCLRGNIKLLAVGSIIQFAENGDVVWGAGIGGNDINGSFAFSNLDVRAVRGPLTREFLMKRGIACPEVYGDPVLLLPILFPEFKRSDNPQKDYIVIPHLSQISLFKDAHNVVLPTEDWQVILSEILNSKLVISGALHGIIAAEAFGVPARFLKTNIGVRSFKYEDYYLGTGRPHFSYATSIPEAILMGGEVPPTFDSHALLNAFPWDKFDQSKTKNTDR